MLNRLPQGLTNAYLVTKGAGKPWAEDGWIVECGDAEYLQRECLALVDGKLRVVTDARYGAPVLAIRPV